MTSGTEGLFSLRFLQNQSLMRLLSWLLAAILYAIVHAHSTIPAMDEAGVSNT
jgi:hypothetical protein